MINIDYFKENIEPVLTGYVCKYSHYSNGDFGDLERVVFEGGNRMGGIDFWSMGWLDIDIYDLTSDMQVMNKLFDSGEVDAQEAALREFVEILTDYR